MLHSLTSAVRKMQEHIIAGLRTTSNYRLSRVARRYTAT